MIQKIDTFFSNYQNIISVFALILAIWSLIRTYWLDRFNIDIVNVEYHLHQGWKPMISFQIFNNSNSAIKILDLKITNTSDVPLQIVDFEPIQTYSETALGTKIPNFIHSSDYADNPIGCLIPANDSYSTRLYTHKYAKDIKVTVITNKKITLFCNKKTFLFPTVELIKYD